MTEDESFCSPKEIIGVVKSMEQFFKDNKIPIGLRVNVCLNYVLNMLKFAGVDPQRLLSLSKSFANAYGSIGGKSNIDEYSHGKTPNGSN
jgi:hypothetical protein